METEKSQRRPAICTNVKEIDYRILQPSLIAKLMLRGHYAMVTRLAKKEFCIVNVNKVNVNHEAEDVQRPRKCRVQDEIRFLRRCL